MGKSIGMGADPLEHCKQRLDMARDLKPGEGAWLVAEVEKLRSGLREIAKGEGRYSREPLEHASNTIEDMKLLAQELLAERDPEASDAHNEEG